MRCNVPSNHAVRTPAAPHARCAAGGGEQTPPNGHVSDGRPAADWRGEFLAMILHELQNPLHSILTGVTFVRDTGGLQPQFEWLWTGLETATQQVQVLLVDLMNLCQATHSTFQLHLRPMDLTAAIHAAVQRRRADFEHQGLRLEFAAGAEAVWLTADPDRLQLVLNNLLDNAAKYTEPGGQILVSVGPAGAEVVLRVRDTGVGITSEVLPFVFDPFVRERFAGFRSRRGSGVGLLLVRTLVELHGGRVEAFSAGRGHGSEFVIHLPRTGPERAP
jgi:signal transduction histidine kinase